MRCPGITIILPLLAKSSPGCEESFLGVGVGDWEAEVETGVPGLLDMSFEQDGEP